MNIAFVAHENKRNLMDNICIAYSNILSKHDLFATATTGRQIADASNLKINLYLSEGLGGEEQLCSQITHNEIDLVIYLKDYSFDNHETTKPNDIFKLCDLQNVPVASNLATAECLLMALDRGDLDWRLNLK